MAHDFIARALGKGRFLVKREIGRGAMGVVYEAVEQDSGLRVAIKTLLNFSPDQVHQFKGEFRSLQDISHPNLCHLIELVEEEGVWFIVMELVEGLDFLSFSTRANRSDFPIAPFYAVPRHSKPGAFPATDHMFDEERLRRSLSGVIRGLAALHAAGKVHRDIKPSNVLVNHKARAVLLDFGLVLDPKEIRASLDSTGGTIEYMAPEMAGATRVGPEADWYSVGVMLYEILAGALPFSGDPRQIFIDKQIKEPAPIANPENAIPGDLVDLCMALLRPDPGERPRTGEIFRLLELRLSSNPLPFVYSLTPGASQQCPIFVGRQDELGLLHRTFEDSLDGCNVTVVVEGVSGVGKTALCQQFIHQITDAYPDTIFLSGRCYERETVPFKAVDGVIDALVNYLLGLAEDDVAALLPTNAPLLLRVFPTLSRVGAFARLPASRFEMVDPHEMQRRAFRALRQLLVHLTRRHPVVVTIDDMQWTDSDSLLLFEELLRPGEAPPLLLLLLSRFEDFGGNSVLNWGAVAPGELQRIRLQALSREDSRELAQLCLRQARLDGVGQDPSEIADEAEGHPMYITELVQLASLGESQRLESHPRVDDAILRRVDRLSPEARRLLELICVAGVPLREEFLEDVSGLGKAQFMDGVAQLRSARLLRSGGVGKNAPMEPYHHRVREAVMGRLVENAAAETLHLEIGRLLWEESLVEKNSQDLFEVAWHMNAGRGLIDDPEELHRLSLLNVQAGKEARASAAYSSAVDHFENSLKLVGTDTWQKHYEETLCLYVSAAEAAYLKGAFSRTSDLVSEALLHVKSILDRAKLYEVLVQSLNVQGRPREAIDKAVGIINELGFRLPVRPSKLHILVKIIEIKFLLRRKTAQDLLAAPEVSDPRVIAAKRLMASIGAPTYILGNTELWATLILNSTAISIRYGKDPLSSVAFGCWGVINSSVLKKPEYGYQMGQLALEMLELFEDKSKGPMVLYIWALFLQHWKAPLRQTLFSMQESYESAVELGDLVYLGLSVSSYCNQSFFAGQPLARLLDECAFYVETQEQANQWSSRGRTKIYQQTVANLMGQADDPSQMVGEFFDENEILPLLIEKGEKINLFHYYLYRLILKYMFGRYQEAAASVEEARTYHHSVLGTFGALVFPFYDSLVFLALCRQEGSRPSFRLKRRIEKNQRALKQLAALSPENHLHKFKLIEASRAWLTKKPQNAAPFFEDAISLAVDHGFIQYAALGCELYAEFHLSYGDKAVAEKLLRDARRLYDQWGAVAKVQQLEEKARDLFHS